MKNKLLTLSLFLIMTVSITLSGCNKSEMIHNPHLGVLFSNVVIAYADANGSLILVHVRVENISDNGQNFQAANFSLETTDTTRQGKYIRDYATDDIIGNIPLAAGGIKWFKIDFKQSETDSLDINSLKYLRYGKFEIYKAVYKFNA